MFKSNLFIFLFSMSAYANNLDSLILQNFKKEPSENVWISTKNPSTNIVFNKLENSWFEIEKQTVKDYVEKLEYARSTLGFFAGITEFKVINSKLEAQIIPGLKTLVISGFKTEHSKKIYFIEKQVFKKPDIHQIKISSADEKSINDSSVNEAFAEIEKALK